MKKITFLLFALLLTTTSAYAGHIGVCGKNTYGQFGSGTTSTTANWTSVSVIGTDTNWVKVASGYFHSFAFKTNGTLWAWGLNSSGQLGDGTTIDKTVPTQIGTDTDWKQIDGGEAYTMALKTDGTLWGWGDNSYGQLGDETNIAKTSPTRIGTDHDWAYVDCGPVYTIAIKTNGTLWTWGCNTYGQLGDGTTTSRNYPLQIGIDMDWAKVAASGRFFIGIKTNGTVWKCDGTNSYLGEFQPGNNWEKVSAGLQHFGAISSDSTAYYNSTSYPLPYKSPTETLQVDSPPVKSPQAICNDGWYYHAATRSCKLCELAWVHPVLNGYIVNIGFPNNGDFTYSVIGTGEIWESNLSTCSGTSTGYPLNKISSTLLWGDIVAGMDHILVIEKIDRKVNPTIIWDNPVNITYGTALSTTQLNATANALGEFTYTPAPDSVLSIGTHELIVEFTPTFADYYNVVRDTVSITVTAVEKSPSVITWDNPADMTYGTALSATQLNATTVGDIPGEFSYNPAMDSVLAVGDNQELTVIFTPTDAENYATAYDTVYLNVKKAMPIITWSNPADMTYGTALSATQLNATTVGDIPGEFMYNPTIGTVLNVSDNQELTVIFTATDASNYEIAKDTVYLNVKSSAVDVINHEADVTLFSIDPNPASHQFHINGLKGSAKITLTDMEGKVYLQKTITNGELISIENMPTGVYVLQIQTPNKAATLKLVKE